MEQNLQNLQLPVSIWKIIPTCYHRNKGEVEYISLSIDIFYASAVHYGVCFHIPWIVITLSMLIDKKYRKPCDTYSVANFLGPETVF